LLASVLTLCLAFSPEAAVAAPPQPLIAQKLDENNRVALKGNVRPEANAANDRGLAADDFPMEHMLLQLQRPPEEEQALEEFIDQLYAPASPNFHQWLTAQEFGERFGPARADLNTIAAWLKSRGFQINVAYPSGMVIDFSGSAGKVREAFGTEIHYLEINGVEHIANMSDPQIPAALAPAVVGIVSLHDFTPRVMHKVRSDYTFTSGNATYEAVVPADLATIYNLTPLFATEDISGQGQTVAVIEDSNVYRASDWTTFRETFGLSSYQGSFTQVQPQPPSGAHNCSNPGANADDGEAILDAEWASAAAPSASIVLAACADTRTTFGGLIALENLINGASPPPVISISYGECEASNGASANAAYNAAYEQAVSEGISVFVAAGDEGAASCDAGASQATHGIGVSGFASTPYNVAVGGTDFGDAYAGSSSTYWGSTNGSSYGSALFYIPEIAWNDSCASVLLASYLSGSDITYGSNGFCSSRAGREYEEVVAGSGGPSGCATGAPSSAGVVSGTCRGYAKPSWQTGFVGIQADGVRDIPDVSLFAGNGIWGHYYVMCWSDIRNGGARCTGAPSTWSGAGGTSFSTAIMAGIQALVNQRAKGRQGNPNPVYYRMATGEYGVTGAASCNSTNVGTAASSCVFYDVTQGDMDVNCAGSQNCYGSSSANGDPQRRDFERGFPRQNRYMPSGGEGVLSTSDSSYVKAYGATTGWDFATGIGTINAYELVTHWP
jgi:subtilase family serine protease